MKTFGAALTVGSSLLVASSSAFQCSFSPAARWNPGKLQPSRNENNHVEGKQCSAMSQWMTAVPLRASFSFPPSLKSSVCLSMSSSAATSSSSSSANSGPGSDPYANVPEPTTFREAEVLGLRLMQDGRHEEALKAFQQAMKLPGSRPDIVRTANVPGPSPVGGAKGGTEGREVRNLDEFELQAAHYNVACAYACLGLVGESVTNLKRAFDYGFDNYATVRADPDLSNVQSTNEFERLMEDYDPKKGFNMFGVFGKK